MSGFGQETPPQTRYNESVVLTAVVFLVVGPCLVACAWLALELMRTSPGIALADRPAGIGMLPMAVFVAALVTGLNCLLAGVIISTFAAFIEDERDLLLFALAVGAVMSFFSFVSLLDSSEGIFSPPWGRFEGMVVGGCGAFILTRLTRFLRRGWRNGPRVGVTG